MDTYSMFSGHTVPGVVTGKPVDIGGSLGRQSATGRGVMYITHEVLHRLGIPVQGTKIAVQGFGNVGGTAAELLHKEGACIVAASDVSGGLYCAQGLDIEDIRRFLAEDKSRMIKDYESGEVLHISNEELLTAECDVLIPAALENQIRENLAERIRAHIIIEAANGPTTAEADVVLEKRDVMVVPDILANAGGVVASYFEWVQNIQSLTWDLAEVNSMLEKIMIRAFNRVWEEKENYHTSMRMGAYLVALDRIVKAGKCRGLLL